MTWAISKDFAFSASHQLTGLREGHPCGRLHGHNYTVRVTIASDQLDATGFVVDYGDLQPFGAWLDATVDHRHLNSLAWFHEMNPTAENLAQWMAVVLRRSLDLIPAGALLAVDVSETPKTWASYVEPA